MPIPLIARLWPGATVRCEELPRRYLPGLYRFAAVRLGPGADAEDVAAETLVAAVEQWGRRPRRRPSGPDDDPLRAWLFGIARRKVADALRSRTRDQRPVPQPEPGPPPIAGTLAAEAGSRLAAILSDLPDDQREALLLKYVDGLSLEEIGAVLERTPVAVGSLLHRARASARQRGQNYFGTEAER